MKGLTGLTIDGIQIQNRIGKGGMGAVYKGYDIVLERQVAVKVIRREGASPERRARFRREARLLSRLDHPGICKIYRYLEDELSGEQLLILEYVEGVELGASAFQLLPFAQKLAISIQIVEAVSFAHSNDILHRDLKPSNILYDPKRRQTKIMDFGIGRFKGNLSPYDGTTIPWNEVATENDTYRLDENSTHLTRGIVGTVRYMSPEQATNKPDITPATDIYSLGILFQELWTGTSAYPEELEGKNLLSSVIKGETRPPEDGPVGIRKIISRMKEVPAGARPNAREVLRGLEELSAKPRRRIALISATLLSTLVIFGVVKYTLGLEEARERAEAAKAKEIEARELAQIDRQRADEVADFLSRVVLKARPSTENPRDLNIIDVLDSLRIELDSNSVSDPVRKASFSKILGYVYILVGELELAEKLLLDAVDLRLRAPEIDEWELAHTYRYLGNLYQEWSKLDQAVEMQNKGILTLESDPVRAGHLLNFAYMNLGNSLRDQGKFDAALALYEKALQVHGAELPDDFPADCLENMLYIYSRRGEVNQFEAAAREVLEVREQFNGATHIATARAALNLGIALCQQGRHSECEPYLRRSLDIKMKILGPAHPSLAMGYYNFAHLNLVLGRVKQASKFYESAYRIFVSNDIRRASESLKGMGDVAFYEQKFDAAVSYYERAEENWGDSDRLHPAFLDILLAKTTALIRQGQFIEARRVGSMINENIMASSRANSGQSLISQPAELEILLGRLATELGQVDQAKGHWDAAIEILEKSREAGWGTSYRSLYTRALIHLGRLEEARPIALSLLEEGWNESEFLHQCKLAKICNQ